MSKDKHDPKPSLTEPTEAQAAAAAPVHAGAEKGTIAATRRAPLPDPTRLFQPPADYHPLEKDTILPLSKIAQNQEAELDLASHQVIDKAKTFQVRFGELAPDTQALPALWKRYQDASTNHKIAEQQVSYFGDIAQVALHDVLQVLGLVDETVRPAAGRNAQIAEEFSAVLKISDQRGTVIRDAKARAKSEKQAALAAGGEPTDTTKPTSKK